MPVVKSETMDIRTEQDVVKVRQVVRSWAAQAGFSLVDQTKLVTAASELGRNTLIHGKGGTTTLELIHEGIRKGLRMTFVDQGPGISDIEQAMKDGYTTGGGLGLGLSGSQRLMNEFKIVSQVGKGTQVTIARWNLRKSEERFRLMIEEVKDYAIFLLDTEGRFATWNVGAERILGWKEAEIIGQQGRLIFTPEDRENGVPESEIQTATETGRAEDERWHLRKDGSLFCASSVMTTLRDEKGQLLGYVKILRDVTERYAADKQRTRYVTEIEELNARLQRAMAETHHRVKNNLQVISALVDAQVMDSEGTLPDSALQRIGQHVNVLASIHDLLTEGAKRGVDMDVVSSKQTLERLIPMAQATVGNRRIHAHVEDALLPIRHAASLSILVNELISNSIKHGSGEIELSFTVVGEMAWLRVCDNGPGFPPGFNPGQAANTGLDLIESVGRLDLRGDITYDNREEGGARVTVTFPLHQPD